MLVVRALSLRQPWATAVLQGKSIENRRWSTSFRGEFLIHAAKGCTRVEYDDALAWIGLAAGSNMPFPETVKGLPLGGIVGRATLVDVIKPHTEPITWTVQAPTEPGSFRVGADLRWWMREQFGFVLSDVRPTPFVPCKGALGFWDVPGDVLAKVLA